MQTLKIASRQRTAAKKETRTAFSDRLYHLAFDTSLQASIISTVKDGKIIEVNMAACKLLENSKEDLLTKTKDEIFNTTESSFQKMLKQRTEKGYARAHVTVIRNGQQVPCEITSVIFVGDHGIAKALTTIVDTGRQIADAVMEAHELERSEIGKELHDNVNQLLSASNLYIDMALKDVANMKTYLMRSSEYTITAIEEIRKISRGMVTDVIKVFGLKEAIDNICTDTMEVHPVKISCIMDQEIENRVTDKFKHDVYRIIQAQLTNIINHAKASAVKIALTKNEDFIVLIIADDGIGFDTAKKTKGIGIKNIKSRALTYNGNASFASQPGQGCTLTVTFPGQVL